MQILHDLGLEPYVILVNIIGFLILLALLRKYFFGPVGEFLAARQQQVAEQLHDAEQSQQQTAEELATIRSRREEMIAKAEQEAQQARRQAQQQTEQMIEEARHKAHERERRAEQAIAQQSVAALAQLRNQVSGLSVDFAQRVLQEALDEQRHRQLVEAVIEDVEKLAGNRQE